MDDFEDIPTVRLGRRESALRWRTAAAIAVALLFVLVAKPWGDRNRPTGALPGPRLTASPSPRPVGRHYDPALFGRYEIQPAWEIWPAGYVYKFGIAGPLVLDPTPAPPVATPAGSRGPDESPAPTPTPVPTPAPTPPPGAADLVDLGSADHLLVVGLNTPESIRVAGVRLWHFDRSGLARELDVIELPPPWPVTYFHVYALRPSGAGDELGIWEAGTYRLDVTIQSGGTRRIGLHVAAGVNPSPAPG